MKRLLWKIVIVAVVIMAVFEVIGGIVIFNALSFFNNSAQREIMTLENIKIPVPKDGQNATPQQISQALTTYLAQNPIHNGIDGQNATNAQVQNAVNQYMQSHPVQNGKDGQNGTNGKDGQNGTNGVDGKDGLDGLTPQLRCNVTKNEWEVRYSEDQNWQLLNGQTTKCTVSTK